MLLDGPMAFFFSLTMLFLALYVRRPRGRTLYAAACSAGLAFLSKETAILMVPAVLVFFMLARDVPLKLRDLGVSALVYVLTIAPFPLSLFLTGGSRLAQEFFIWQLLRRPNHDFAFYLTVVPTVGIPLAALALVGFLGWLVARQRLVPRRPVGTDEQLAGATVALLGLGIVSLLVLATNPFALIFFLPAMHAWLWLPQVQSSKAPTRAVIFLIGLIGPMLIILSLALRFGLGFDAPWYLLELVAVGYVHLPAVVITLCGAACAAQLAVVTAGRYAPYPPAGQRPERGPLRELVRRLVLAQRARRRRAAARRPAVE